jgi:CubicO group peptidase (beta-lactamase class C family)
MDIAKLDEARDYSIAAGQTGDEAGIIARHGRVVYSWGNLFKRYEMKSTTKSMGGLAFLAALDDGKLALTDKASDRLPVFGTSPAVDTSPVSSGSLPDITLLQLATHTSGLSKSDQAATLKLLYTPGSTWSYSDQGLNWLADVLTQTYAQDLQPLMFSRIYTTLGIRATDLVWRTNAFRSATLSVNGVDVPRREFASGINSNVDAMARVGLLMLRRGVWKNDLLLSNAIVDQAHRPPPEVASAVNIDPANFTDAPTNYGILWWTNATGRMSGVPRDAYWAWGLHETFIIIVPSLDLVIARAGDHAWHPAREDWNADYAVLEPFLTPIIEAVH